jgi:hypothetical protein
MRSRLGPNERQGQAVLVIDELGERLGAHKDVVGADPA